MKLPIMVVLKIHFPSPLFSKLCLTLVAYLIFQLTIYQINCTCISIRCVSQAYLIHSLWFYFFSAFFFAVLKSNVYLICELFYKKTEFNNWKPNSYILTWQISATFLYFFMCPHSSSSSPCCSSFLFFCPYIIRVLPLSLLFQSSLYHYILPWVLDLLQKQISMSN